jgi:uncharacterized protein YcfL
MKQFALLVLPSILMFSGCSSNENTCEDVTLASEQIQQCQALQRQIIKAKQEPLIRTELERRYQADCVDIRFYRDDKQAGVCGNKAEVKNSEKPRD